MRRKLGFLLTAAVCIMAHAEEASQPAWSAAPQAYATVSNIFAAGASFNRALVVDQVFVEETPGKDLRFCFLFYGPSYRIYSDSCEARSIKQREFLYC